MRCSTISPQKLSYCCLHNSLAEDGLLSPPPCLVIQNYDCFWMNECHHVLNSIDYSSSWLTVILFPLPFCGDNAGARVVLPENGKVPAVIAFRGLNYGSRS
ncbi:hypothetical protein LXL04_020205 [Taraxacum kok-saghyz]